VHHIIEERPTAKLDQIPMREFGKPEQIAKICWFFASDLSEYTPASTCPATAAPGGAETIHGLESRRQALINIRR
jgi:NAD(P)-dependent dehydrogenase (short-subunit alcohol dehydrogenase family)